MKIEVLKGKEIGKTRALYEEVFQDSREYTDYFYEKVQREGTAFAAEENNEVISELFLIPKHLICNNKIIEALYVYGVATKTQYRGQGCMDRLMKEALIMPKKAAQSFFILFLSVLLCMTNMVFIQLNREKYEYGNCQRKKVQK